MNVVLIFFKQDTNPIVRGLLICFFKSAKESGYRLTFPPSGLEGFDLTPCFEFLLRKAHAISGLRETPVLFMFLLDHRGIIRAVMKADTSGGNISQGKAYKEALKI